MKREAETAPVSRDASAIEAVEPEAVLALVIVWCRGEPERVGELVALPADGDALVIGRSDEPVSPRQGTRAEFVRERPGVREVRPPLSSERLSRVQLTARALGPRRVAIDNLGRRAMLHDGVRTTHVTLRPGETIEIDGELVLLVVLRDAQPAGPVASHPFGTPDTYGLAGESPVVWRLRGQIAFAARHGGHVLACGPRGVGKELALRAVHAASGALAGELVARSVPALGDDRLGRELFGDRMADGTHHPGVLAQATSGALLLDDLDRGSAALGGYLTRFLDTGELFALGDPRPMRTDLRILATVEDPEQLLPALRSRFRHVLVVPSLTERREDLPLIARARLALILDEHPVLAERFRGAASHARLRPSWVQGLIAAELPNGIRDIDAFIWRTLATSSGAELEAVDIGPLRKLPPPEAIVHTKRHVPDDLPPSVARGLPELTPTERVILVELSANKTSRQIATSLFVSLRTVQNHRARICEKLGLRGPNALLEVALALGDYLTTVDTNE